MSSANYVAPNAHRHLRACMICSYVQVMQKFIREGCPNCEMAVGLQGNPEKVDDCTSPVFEGLIALVDNTKSWVARYQRLEGYVPGMYAVKVVGNLPEEVIQQLEDANIPYYPRDGSDDTGRAS